MPGPGYISGQSADGNDAYQRLLGRPAVFSGWTDAEAGEDQEQIIEKHRCSRLLGILVGNLILFSVATTITTGCLWVIATMVNIIRGLFS
jgi:hypothetical protein